MESTKKQDLKSMKPFRMGVFARSGGGKSYMTFKWILQLLKSGFVSPERTILISRTYKSDPSQKELVDYCKSQYKAWES